MGIGIYFVYDILHFYPKMGLVYKQIFFAIQMRILCCDSHQWPPLGFVGS